MVQIMGKRSFWQSLRRKKWLASTGILAAGALAVYGVWQIPALNQYHMETLDTPAPMAEEKTEDNDNASDLTQTDGLQLPREEDEASQEQPEQESKEEEEKENKILAPQEEKKETGDKEKLKKTQTKKKEKKKEKEQESVTVLSNPQSVLDAGNFDESAGLSWPMEGDVILNYDTEGVVYFETLAQYKANPAIMIGGTVGNEVKASADGVVEKIVKNEETGLTVTMSVGNSYEIVYGQLDNLKISEGDEIKEGTLLGTLAEPTDYFTVEGANLYYQILKDGAPVNPLLLLK